MGMNDSNPITEGGAIERLGALGPALVPDHVAVIMDGNGRWAQSRGLERLHGHREGAKTVRRVLETSARLGIGTLTLYSFSTENWRRPEDEIEGLMRMCVEYCNSERDELIDQNVRVRVIGTREGLGDEVLGALDALVDATSACDGVTLCLAINYGSRDEIVRAARDLARRAASGEIDAEGIDEHALADSLDTRGLPDPDLLIRTGGEMRLSNYLLWQLSYAEIMVTDTPWPELSAQEFASLIESYTQRSRRFGHTRAPSRVTT